MSNFTHPRQRQQIVQRDEPNWIRKNVTKNFHVDDSLQIHKYNNVLITCVYPIRGTGGVYKVCTSIIKDVYKVSLNASSD